MDYSVQDEELKRIILPFLSDIQIKLVELKLIKTSEGLILKLLVDRNEGGINLDECARINKKIGEIIEFQSIIKNKYILEVSSPGLDRPLKTKDDFLRCLNKKAKFFLNELINGKLEWNGLIKKVGQESVFIRLRAEDHGCKPVDECGQTALRRMSLNSIEGGPAEAKRRRVDKGTTPVKAWGSISIKDSLIEVPFLKINKARLII